MLRPSSSWERVDRCTRARPSLALLRWGLAEARIFCVDLIGAGEELDAVRDPRFGGLRFTLLLGLLLVLATLTALVHRTLDLCTGTGVLVCGRLFGGLVAGRSDLFLLRLGTIGLLAVLGLRALATIAAVVGAEACAMAEASDCWPASLSMKAASLAFERKPISVRMLGIADWLSTQRMS